jgi:hypothetical protein
VEASSWRHGLVGALWLACLLSAACAKPPPAERVPFSEAMRERYRLGEPELRGLQYYISHQIVLERAVAGGTRRVDHGRLIVRGGTSIHQVVLPPGTPGWIEAPAFVGEGERTHVLEVSFERGAPLRFSPVEPDGAYVLSAPDARPSGAFADLFASWGRPRRFEVTFAGEKWRVVAGADASLLIETDALEELHSTRRVLPGVRGPVPR